MYPHWNPNINQQYVYSSHPARNTLHHDSQYMMQRIASLENQLTKLISLIEENNQLIKSMEQQKTKFVRQLEVLLSFVCDLDAIKNTLCIIKVCFLFIIFFSYGTLV